MEKLFLSLHPQVPQPSVAYEKETSYRKGTLLTINDRITGLVWIRCLLLTKAAIKALMPIKEPIHTITTDNGKEFSFHHTIHGKEVLMKIQMDSLENTSQKVRTLEILPKNKS